MEQGEREGDPLTHEDVIFSTIARILFKSDDLSKYINFGTSAGRIHFTELLVHKTNGIPLDF